MYERTQPGRRQREYGRRLQWRACDCEGKLDGLCCRGESYLLIGMQRDRRGSTLLVACQGRAVRQDRAALRGAARGRLDVGQADTYF